MTDEDRYEGKPLLKLFESYALAVIGELPEDSDAAVRLVVQRVFESEGDWMSTLRTELALGPEIDDTIRENWLAYQDAARAAGVENSALEFAKLFADAAQKASTDE